MDETTEAARGDDRSPVTIIGLGVMGTALAGAFLNEGHRTTVWNRSASKADDLVANGAARAATVAEAVLASPLVVVCLRNYDVVQEILHPVGDALSGRVLVNLTAGTPQQARATARWTAERGADYIAGAIMVGAPMIGQPDALVLYSGPREAFETHRRALGSLGVSRYLGAEPALAPLHDQAVLGGTYAMLAGFVHAIALIRTEDVDAAEFTSALLIPRLEAMAVYMHRLAERVDTGDHGTGVDWNLGMQAKDVSNLVQVSRAEGVRADLLASLQALMDQAIAEGHGADDLSRVVETLRTPPAR
jgi:3-hydroxyisobutyrate dehydrogenase-like beta-hydroxyacid dehydrogenase